MNLQGNIASTTSVKKNFTGAVFPLIWLLHSLRLMRKRITGKPFRQHIHLWLLLGLGLGSFTNASSQNTVIRGFADATVSCTDKKVSFGFGEQDLFITSEVTDRISFLGESVFKYDHSAETEFAVSIERIVMKYNYYRNHNILIGKHHTPVNYWNDTYHHGRVFFPTIYRPLLFDAGIVPLHTTGVDFQGQNLGQLRFGYDVMIGNGIGSSSVADNDAHKSVTLAAHIKPVDRLRIGASYYHDAISKGTMMHDDHRVIGWDVKQNLLTGSVSYFGKKAELLAESTMGSNRTDTTGTKNSLAAYLYGGYRVTENWIPYFRVDYLRYPTGEVFYRKNNTTAFLAGLRYQFSYLAVAKLEYQYEHSEAAATHNRIVAQLALGF